MSKRDLLFLADGLERAAQSIWRGSWWPEMAIGGPLAYAQRLANGARQCRDAALGKEGS